jgi:hypothetical protein
LSVKIHNHPLTEGVGDFLIDDEPYLLEPSDKINIFATYKHDGADIPAGWEYRHGAGVLVYLMFGHDEKSFQNKNYRRLIKNAVDYLFGM